MKNGRRKNNDDLLRLLVTNTTGVVRKTPVEIRIAATWIKSTILAIEEKI